MPEEFEVGRGPSVSERFFGGWRMVASAWVVAIVLVMLFAGVQAFASRHSVSPRAASFAGVVIPRHDPTCAGPEEATASASQLCQAGRDAFERAENYSW